jgi:mono/diheme cytochrome c family protein
MRLAIRSTLLLLVAMNSTRTAFALDGEQIYRAQCAPCHGVDGRGDGPDAALLAKKPTDLRERGLHKYSTEQLAAKIRSGRELPLAVDENAARARSQEVESLVVYVRHIPSTDWEQVEGGEAIYVTRCASCHGDTGKPPAVLPAGVSAPRDLSDPKVQSSISDALLLETVRHGRAGMPALVPQVKMTDGPPLSAYVRLLSPGYTSYVQFCMSCHGRDGRGVGTLGEEMTLPTVVFDRRYVEHTDAEVLRTRVWHMVAEHQMIMPHHRSLLNEKQVLAVAQYMRKTWK